MKEVRKDGWLIREFRDADEPAVVKVWHRSGRAAYTFLPTWQAFTLGQADRAFRAVIRPTCDIWVAVSDQQIVAFLAMKGSCIDRMYVDPDHQGRGWGTRLLEFAKQRSADGLELHTHQQNTRACAFYERHGFATVRFGTSPPPERAPDVEYHWRPRAQTRIEVGSAPRRDS
jgi:ribosomal protein S18 acetylase RimI-like enzyme